MTGFFFPEKKPCKMTGITWNLDFVVILYTVKLQPAIFFLGDSFFGGEKFAASFLPCGSP